LWLWALISIPTYNSLIVTKIIFPQIPVLGFKSKVDRYPDPGSLVKKQTYVTCVCVASHAGIHIPASKFILAAAEDLQLAMPISFLKNNMNECRQSAKG
jgi:hypothetical protein